MIRFRTLGSLDLRNATGGEVASVLAHSKRTALLAYLATASPRGHHRRDTLLALFWPELDETHARASLRKAVHHLRRSLGEDVLLGRGDEELALDETKLWCDAAAFDDALARDDLAEATELYRGPFLQGFFVADSSEFELWAAQERARRRDRAAHAAWQLAEGQHAAGDLFGA